MSTRPPNTHTTRSARRRKEALLRAGVWVFLIIFAFSVAGGALIAVGTFNK